MPEHPISSHMGIQLAQDASFAHTRLHIQVTHDHWTHAWEPDHFMHDGTAHKHSIYSCMSSWHLHECLMISWVAHWTHVAGFSTAINCSLQVAAASRADLIVHGIPKGAHSAPSHSYLQASSRHKRKRHVEGNNRQGWSGAESPSKLKVKELQTQGRQKAQLMLFRMWSNVQSSWAILYIPFNVDHFMYIVLLARLRNTCVASRKYSSPRILPLEKALQLFESWTSNSAGVLYFYCCHHLLSMLEYSK